MKKHVFCFAYALLAMSACCLFGCASFETTTENTNIDPLPSWNDGVVKQNIIGFVNRVTNKSGSDYVPPEKRIATFDNDGTLWSEQPIYFQLVFTMDRIKALASANPEWKTRPAFMAILKNDMKAFAASGKEEILEVLFFWAAFS